MSGSPTSPPARPMRPRTAHRAGRILLPKPDPRARRPRGLPRALALLLLFPTACASAGTAPEPGSPPPEDARIRPPERVSEPGMPVAWVREGLPNAPSASGTLMVRGQGEVRVDPDRAHVSFAVETEHESARGAGEENARRMTGVIDALRASAGEIPGFRIETSGYSLTPRYQASRESGVREIVGYTARNHVVVTVDRVAEVGRVMDVALRSGANRISRLQFLVQDPEPHRAAALREAIRVARVEAETIADALGMRLGAALHVEGGADAPSPMARSDAMFSVSAVEGAPETPLEPGAQTIGASVSIRFRLEPRR